MALSATTQWEVQNGGSDTICSGAFDPGQTAGMFTDGAATVANTAAPVFTSASYTFVAGDVNAYVFIGVTGGATAWTLGWYKITAVNGGAATLSAAAEGYRAHGASVNTSAGCAAGASPTAATWAIDYSQQAAARYAYTDLACVGAGLAVSSALKPFAKEQVGNSIIVTGGDVNITAGIYVIASVAAGVATVLGAANISIGAVTTGAGNQGGAHASIGMPGGFHVAGNTFWVKYHATAYTSVSSTNNVAGGRFTAATGSQAAPVLLRGYESVRGDETANRPSLTWANGYNATTNYILTGRSYFHIENLIVNGNGASATNAAGINLTTSPCYFYKVRVTNCNLVPVKFDATSTLIGCELDNNGGAFSGPSTFDITAVNGYFHDNTANGPVFTVNQGSQTYLRCIFDTNRYNIQVYAGYLVMADCVVYGTTGTGPGITISTKPYNAEIINTIFESNTGVGLSFVAQYETVRTINCAFYNNTGGKYTAGGMVARNIIGEIIPTATVFVDAANGDFRLNNGAGRALKSGGYPATMPGLTWPNYPALGAASLNAGSGGGGYFAPW